jgi:carbamoyl-phosphate synthase small subunit
VEVHVLPATTTGPSCSRCRRTASSCPTVPGDPATTDGPVEATRAVLDAGVPLFGICFGNQILGRALGLGTYKLRYGHRGVNSPVQDLRTGRVHVTSHNHGFAVDAPSDGSPVDTPYGPYGSATSTSTTTWWRGWSCSRPRLLGAVPPEAAPGPHDATGLFSSFVALMEA